MGLSHELGDSKNLTLIRRGGLRRVRDCFRAGGRFPHRACISRPATPPTSFPIGAAGRARAIVTFPISVSPPRLDMEELLDIRGLTLFVSGQSNDGGGFCRSGSSATRSRCRTSMPRRHRDSSKWAPSGAFGEDGEHWRARRPARLECRVRYQRSARTWYINSVFGIGQDLSQSGGGGPSIFPTTSLGVSLNLRVAPQWHCAECRVRRRAGRSEPPQGRRPCSCIATMACC